VTGEHLKAQARRVVTGFDAKGRSCIESDEPTPHRLAGTGNTKCDIWRMPAVPAGPADGDGLQDGVVRLPSDGGLIFRIAVFPPDAELVQASGNQPENDQGIALGMHATDTIDITTVLSGEVYAVLETGETLLRPGDTLVQRGTLHAWSNRSDEPVTLVCVMIAATP
jgi:quercetin dioxygenase-like cupin family protein